MSLATKLKELRVRRKQSLQDVADAIGASKTHVWDLETGPQQQSVGRSADQAGHALSGPDRRPGG